MLELVVILLIAFLIVGPKDLPKIARWLARMVKKARSYVKTMKDELGWDELTADVKETKKQVEETLADADVSSELQAAQDEIRSAARDVGQTVQQTAEDVRQSVEEK